MKFISVRNLRTESARIWKDLPREREMVVTTNGRPVAVLTPVGEDDLEESLAAWRQVRATRAIAGLQRESVQRGTDNLSMDEIDAEITAARQARRKS